MAAPCVALFGPNGFIGKEILPAFLDALQTRELSSLKLATRNPSSSAYDAARSRGAIVCPVDFGDKVSLRRMLEDVDIVVSCMGTGGDYKENKKLLVEACEYFCLKEDKKNRDLRANLFIRRRSEREDLRAL